MDINCIYIAPVTQKVIHQNAVPDPTVPIAYQLLYHQGGDGQELDRCLVFVEILVVQS
jgi:hypothetical protein